MDSFSVNPVAQEEGFFVLNILSIHLQAINSEKNIYRQYELYVGKDLFDTWVLTIAYGRIGKVTQMRNYPFSSIEDLNTKLKQILKKRLSSRKRIGTNYHVTSCCSHDDRFQNILSEISSSLI